MNVRAKDLATNKTQSMRIVSSSGLGDNEIDEMIKDATLYRSEDARRREVAEAKNKLDGLIYNTSRSFEEFGDNLTDDDAEAMEVALDAAEDAMETTDLEAIQDAHDVLFTAAQRLADIIYTGLRSEVEEDLLDDDEAEEEDVDNLIDDFIEDDDFTEEL
jgi:molecular chaperone DnaK